VYASPYRKHSFEDICLEAEKAFLQRVADPVVITQGHYSFDPRPAARCMPTGEKAGDKAD
jgi:hypothetical protein